LTRILIIDDHEIVRRGLRDILTSGLGRDLIFGEAGNAASAIDCLMHNEWDLALLDINMPGRNGLEVLAEAKRMRLKTSLLIVTAYPEEDFAIRAFKLGASGYLNKQSLSVELISAVERVLAGGKFLTASLGERLASSLGEPDDFEPHQSLSHRELQVFRLVAVGKSTKEIADQMALSEKTVATYRTRIGQKTGLKTGVEIARYALKKGLVE
jgi:two-component system invasion response regulator UvrY